RYYGSLDFYVRETRNLINFIPVPAGTNLTNFITTNVGNLENMGAEFSLFTRPIIRDDFTWLLGFNASWNQTEVTKLTVVDDPGYLGILTGGIAGGVGNNIQIHSVGYAPYSFFVFQQVYDPNGKPIEGVFVDRNEDGIINEGDMYRFQNRAPRYFMGLTSEFNYRQWTLSFAGRANIGNFVYNNVTSTAGELGWLYDSRGPFINNVHREAITVGFNRSHFFSDYYVQDASFFKMDHITLSYNFGNIMGAGSNLVLSGIVQNAFVITQYEGIDPEVFSGIDYNFYPRPRNFVLSLSLQF
ncbi:MAG TPA: SusC/RagA family protein, partial [Bacteroidales bacterium]|nr:SusC/RagA family protein [Bacteroidales bacterium]